MQRAMWTMLVVMLGVLPQHCSEVVGTDDQKMVEALPRSDPMNRSTIAFARDARTGVQMIRMSAPVNTVSKAVGNLLSRSRIKNRTTQPGRRGP
jgi:hypothetical protein